MESCAIVHITKAVDKLAALKFVVCAEGILHESRNLETIVGTCLATVGHEDLHSGIRTCYTGPEGISIEHVVADITTKLNPPHKWVPWMTGINGASDSNTQN